MANVKPNSPENKEVEPVSDSSGPTQEPLKSHTSSQKNNATGLSEQLSSDEHENPLNGAQPNPFVYSSVPAVTGTGKSLPSGALVNGPGSHPTSEECRVPNKSVLPNNVLDAEWQKEKDTSSQVLPPPCVLQSDGRKNTAGPSPKTPASPPGASGRPTADPEEGESELQYHQALSAHGSDQTHASQMLIDKVTGKERSVWDSNAEIEFGSSSDDDDDEEEAISLESQKKLIQFFWNGCTDERGLDNMNSQRELKHNINIKNMPATPETFSNSLHHAYRHLHVNDNFDISKCNYDPSFKNPDLQFSTATHLDQVCNNPLSTMQGSGCRDGNEYIKGNRKNEKIKTEQSEQEPLFFSCIKCHVNFKEKVNLHRHMMYHLDEHNNPTHHEKVPVQRPFICRECGRSFRDGNSLVKHIIIHGERRQKLMEEIKELHKLEDEGREARLQCSQCVFGSNTNQTFVQHTKLHESEEGRYCCHECGSMALTKQELEAHSHTVHLNTHQPKCPRISLAGESEKVDLTEFHGTFCYFSSQDENVLKNHSELMQQGLCYTKNEKPPFPQVSLNKDSILNQLELADTHSNNTDHIKPLQMKSKLCIKRPAVWRRTDFPYCSISRAGMCTEQSDTSESPQFKRIVGPRPGSLSPSLWTPDKERTLLNPKDSIDVTTGLPYVEEDNQGYDHRALSALSEKHTDHPSSVDFLLTSKTIKTDNCSCHSYDSDNSQENRSDLVGWGLKEQAVTPKSLSKRKMSTPLRNTVNGVNYVVLTKVNQRLKEQSSPDVSEKEEDKEDFGESDDFSDYTSEATANFLDCSVNENNPYARSYFIRKQREPAVTKEVPPVFDQPVENTDDHGDDVDDGEIQQLIIKEEDIESAVCDDLPESPPTTRPTSHDPATIPNDITPSSGATEHPKPCPYCPALFDSGVGLSNHVRGHLHRVGLRYDARHMVSPEQVALQDRHQRIRRKIPAGTRRSKKDKPPESQGEHTCPLCWGWFDTKTGLSNHVRGHLKRIGKTIQPGNNKSPVCILNELLQDEKEHQNILQVLNGKQVFSPPIVTQRFLGGSGLFLAAAGIPAKVRHEDDTDPWLFKDSSVPGPEEGKTFISEREGGLSQTQIESFSGMVSSGTLLRLLKERELERQLDRNAGSYASYRKHFTKESGVEVATGVESNWARVHTGRSKVCVHCNTIFPSAVSLSNHLRAYERRKQLATLEGASYDCKQKKSRSRPGLKRKVFPFSRTAEEIYSLTCRFCDLVFQGPLSVQEDWIKHLQRHIMHNTVAATGTGMVEVLEALQPKMDPLSQDEHTNLDFERHTSPINLPVAS